MQKESRIDRWLRTGFVLFLAVLLLLIIFNGTAKTSDVSNWIIAFANIAMAAAAVKAWLAARKFLSEFFAQEGYRLAIALINENVIHLGMENVYITCTQQALVFCKKIRGKPHAEKSNIRLQSLLQQQRTQSDNHKKWLSNIRSLSFRMETYGIFPADSKKAALNEMVCALDNLIRQGDMFLADLQNIAGRYDGVIRSRKDFYKPFGVSELSAMQTAMDAMAQEWNVMVVSRHALLSGGKHARSLFVVREG